MSAKSKEYLSKEQVKPSKLSKKNLALRWVVGIIIMIIIVSAIATIIYFQTADMEPRVTSYRQVS